MKKVTVTDIDRMRKNITANGVQGAIQTYQELKNKGFGYAGWAEGVADILQLNQALANLQHAQQEHSQAQAEWLRTRLSVWFFAIKT